MDFWSRLSDAQKLAATINDWDKPHFDWQKAYIASVFSRAAYEHIPEFEIKNAERAKLIPCEAYQINISNEAFVSSLHMQTSNEGVSFTVIERRHVVVIITKTKNVLFVSLRGTIPSMADFVTDFDIRKVRYPADSNSLVTFHRGFFEAVASCLPEVVARIWEDPSDEDKPLYLTGHSLGGAMAAIMNAILAEDLPFQRRYRWLRRMPLVPTACYSFGMPRYGNRYAMYHHAYPYHIYNENDGVPTLPPRWTGFTDSPNEYCLSSDGKLLRPHRKGNAFLCLSNGRIQLLGAKEHRIEHYLDQVESAYKNGVN